MDSCPVKWNFLAGLRSLAALSPQWLLLQIFLLSSLLDFPEIKGNKADIKGWAPAGSGFFSPSFLIQFHDCGISALGRRGQTRESGGPRLWVFLQLSWKKCFVYSFPLPLGKHVRNYLISDLALGVPCYVWNVETYQIIYLLLEPPGP